VGRDPPFTIEVPDSRRPVVRCRNNETPVPAEFRVLDSVGVPSKHQRSGESQIRAVLSSEAVTIYRPSGLNAALTRMEYDFAKNVPQQRSAVLAAAAVLTDTVKEMNFLSAHQSSSPTTRLNRAAFSPDGKWLLTASDNGTARVWAIPSVENLVRAARLRLRRCLTGIQREELGLAPVVGLESDRDTITLPPCP
jgi:WD40 repeat protein